MKGGLILGAPYALAHVQTFGDLVDIVIRDIGAGVIEHENVVLFAVRYLGTPVALRISEDAKELAGRHVLMLPINPHPDEFLKVYRWLPRNQRPSRCFSAPMSGGGTLPSDCHIANERSSSMIGGLPPRSHASAVRRERSSISNALPSSASNAGSACDTARTPTFGFAAIEAWG